MRTGTAVFTAGEEELTVAEGHIVVVPAQTPHGFKTRATRRSAWSASTRARPSSRRTSEGRGGAARCRWRGGRARRRRRGARALASRPIRTPVASVQTTKPRTCGGASCQSWRAQGFGRGVAASPRPRPQASAAAGVEPAAGARVAAARALHHPAALLAGRAEVEALAHRGETGGVSVSADVAGSAGVGRDRRSRCRAWTSRTAAPRRRRGASWRPPAPPGGPGPPA